MNNPEFMKDVKRKIATLYEVDSGYTTLMNFDFKSRDAQNTYVKFYAK